MNLLILGMYKYHFQLLLTHFVHIQVLKHVFVCIPSIYSNDGFTSIMGSHPSILLVHIHPYCWLPCTFRRRAAPSHQGQSWQILTSISWDAPSTAVGKGCHVGSNWLKPMAPALGEGQMLVEYWRLISGSLDGHGGAMIRSWYLLSF